MSDLAKPGRVERVEHAPDAIVVGQWYWMRVKHWSDQQNKEVAERALLCVVKLGSNYAELEHVNGSSWRVLYDKFDAQCERELDAASIIDGRVAMHRAEANRLMAQVTELTARLAVTPREQVGDGTAAETQALAVSMGAAPVEDYKKALALAKEKTLPDLFKQIELQNKMMGKWMKATLLPLQAQAEGLKPAIKAIETRIANVELYAGLVEKVKQVQDGEPATAADTLHLLQRRAYMDEECLARYEAGGMTFEHLGDFDRWLVRPENLSRLLPFPRCALAFQVRRRAKEREFPSISAWLSFALSGEGELDKLTFLYLRNGEQVYRLKTTLNFGARLFPDMDAAGMAVGKTYAKMFATSVDGLVSEARYQGMLEDEAAEQERLDAKRAEAAASGKDKSYVESDIFWHAHRESQNYRLWSRDDVYYDDIAAYVKSEIEKHNRLVTLLQGLFDRSPILHPHPRVQLWTPTGFAAAITLVYDDSRALTTGKPIDFDEYRARLNATLQAGSTTVGQEDVWLHAEADKENERVRNDWRTRERYYARETFKPEGNPGPGLIAQVKRMTSKGAQFKWTRERLRHTWRTDGQRAIGAWITVPTNQLLHVNAYTPGDYRLFFDDPRTRANYLQWAPLLLAAEEWHAGNKTGEPKKRRR